MRSRTIYGKDLNVPKVYEFRIEVHGKGGAIGMKCVEMLVGHIESFKAAKKPQEVYERFMAVYGYCMCCVDAGFLDKNAADKLMQLASFLAGNEQARAERESKRGSV